MVTCRIKHALYSSTIGDINIARQRKLWSKISVFELSEKKNMQQLSFCYGGASYRWFTTLAVPAQTSKALLDRTINECCDAGGKPVRPNTDTFILDNNGK